MYHSYNQFSGVSDDCIDILLREVESLCMQSATFSPSISNFSRQFGQKVIEKGFIIDATKDNEINEKYSNILQKYHDWFLNPSDPKLNAWCPREAFTKIENESSLGSSVKQEQRNVSPSLYGIIGRELSKPIVHNLSLKIADDSSIVIGDFILRLNSQGDLNFQKIDSNTVQLKKDSVPAIYRVLRSRKEKKIVELKPHPILAKLFEMNQSNSLHFMTTHLPMLVPPLPWMSTSRGGFLLRPVIFTRLPQNDLTANDLQKWSERCDSAYAIFDSLNQLGKDIKFV